MLSHALSCAALVAVTLILARLTLWAWRSPTGLSRWTRTPAAVLCTIICATLSFFAIRGTVLVHGPRGRPVKPMSIERTPERVARGEHIARATCAGCHTLNTQLPLTGGKNLADEIPMPIGSFPTANLTPAGRISEWSDGELFRAIREGVTPDGKRLLVMSAQRVRNLSDEDLQSVIAFLRSQPAAGTRAPREYVNTLGTIMAGAGMLPLLPGLPPEHIEAPKRGATREYGEYIVKWGGCDECHGPDLTGGKSPIMPPGPSLRSVIGWTSPQFVQTLRTGTTPFGKKLDPKMMPWQMLGRLDDDELTAVHMYLASLPVDSKGKQ